MTRLPAPRRQADPDLLNDGRGKCGIDGRRLESEEIQNALCLVLVYPGTWLGNRLED